MEGPSSVASSTEVAKENALPHVKGLSTVLNETEMQLKIQYFQSRIENYSGPDPIGPRHDFIAWLETHYPMREKKKGLLFEEVVKFCKLVNQEPFNSNPTKNDQRYVDIWLLYATLSSSPLKVYEFMKKQKIGVRSAIFYSVWALELERVGNVAKAQDVFKAGFDLFAEPRNDLQDAYDGFVIRRTSCRGDEPELVGDGERQALNTLRPVGRTRVMAPVERTGRNVLGPAGVLKLSSSSAGGRGPNARVTVMEDGENEVPGLTDDQGEDGEEEEEDEGEGAKFEDILRSEENDGTRIAFGSRLKLPGRRVGPKVPMSALSSKPKAFTIYCEEEPSKDIEHKPQGPLRAEINPVSSSLPAARKTEAPAHNDPNLHFHYSPSAISIEERLAAALKHSFVTKTSLRESRAHMASAEIPEVDMWLWTTAPTLTRADLPPNGRMIVPDEVFQEKSLDEVLLERRMAAKNARISKAQKRKSPDHCPEEPHAEVEDTANSSEQNLDTSFLSHFEENPFSEDLRNEILRRNPCASQPSFFHYDENLPKIQLREKFFAKNGDEYVVDKIVGEGAYAKVFRANVTRNTDRRNSLDQTMIPMKDVVVFKVQKPACPWELYICSELHRRLQQSAAYSIRKSIVKVSKAYVFRNGSLLVSNFEAWGSLLCAVNHYKVQKRPMPECLVFCFAYDILQIVQSVHECSVIHADLKVDNFLLADVPSINKSGKTEAEVFGDETRCLQLIDFGRAIDMNILPTGTKFTYVAKAADFRIPEMREGRAWDYHIDHFGVAATVFALLFGRHLELEKVDGLWTPAGVHFRRPLQGEFWKNFFDTLLNIPPEGPLPDLADLRKQLFHCFVNSKKIGEVEKFSAELKGFLNS